ncbi:MAG TPA: SRPBCC domain-containing protein [Devosia sp.]|jgi:uncharacterized protein YndB with AHSA1/START domain|uniref:SRPBCC domain-containing protein n=1 Tax=Devosia sp. TaxID=1871048 RepID=UPI002DDD75EF|nr:SRPBCC domain-containing protein [Devosia sp.]HEV2514764.1 SRPBCC domain-containing protein [Devosia sp.]
MSREPLHVTLTGERAIRMVRRFQAPRELVFAALTTPALLQRWYAELVSAELDLRVGGNWRIVTRRPDGREIGQRGTYREVEPPSRLVQTEHWEDWDPGEVLVTTTLTEAAGVTTLDVLSEFPTADVRELLVKAGMNDESVAHYDRLEDLLAEMG